MWLVQIQENNPTIDLDLDSIRTEPIRGDVDWIDLVHRGIVILLVLAGFLSLVFMIWGGIQFIISGGKEEKVSKATQTIRNAFIGLIITILSFTIISIVGKIFGLDLLPYLDFKTVINDVNNFFSTY